MSVRFHRSDKRPRQTQSGASSRTCVCTREMDHGISLVCAPRASKKLIMVINDKNKLRFSTFDHSGRPRYTVQGKPPNHTSATHEPPLRILTISYKPTEYYNDSRQADSYNGRLIGYVYGLSIGSNFIELNSRHHHLFILTSIERPHRDTFFFWSSLCE